MVHVEKLRIILAILLSYYPVLRSQAQTAAGQVHGKILVSGSDDLTEELLRGRSLLRYELHIHASSETIPPYRLSEKAVVYIEPFQRTDPGFEPPATHPQLNQSQMLFRPLVLPVLAGTVVEFPNSDNLFHNVFSYSQPREFDLGRYPRGQKKSVLFSTPGVVKVYCDIHSYMYATVIVLDNPYFTVPDDEGNYSIGGIPAGRYLMTLWYGRKKVATKPVVVEEGKSASVNFEY